jgi:hypothetical protein
MLISTPGMVLEAAFDCVCVSLSMDVIPQTEDRFSSCELHRRWLGGRKERERREEISKLVL